MNPHYFNIEPELMQERVLGWKRPDVHIPSLASAELFGADPTPICSALLALVS